MPLFDLGFHDTAYPYLLFLRQAETERILEQRLITIPPSTKRFDPANGYGSSWSIRRRCGT